MYNFVELKPNQYIQREISWLSFNGRVLQEAADKTVPLVERIKFLGIFSSNLDEFFRVRVAMLRKLSRFKINQKFIEYSADRVLAELYTTVLKQQKKFDATYAEIIKAFANEKIFIINEAQLSHSQSRFVQEYFQREVLPTLVPVMIDSIKDFPYLKEKSIYLAVRLSKKDNSKKSKHALIEIPTDVLNRFLILPKIGENKYIILLDDIIRFCLKDIFYIFNYDVFEAWTIKLTRDAELEIDNDFSENLIENVSKSLQKRKKGLPVRFVYDKTIPLDFLTYLSKRMHLNQHDLIAGGRYHNFKDFIKFPNVGSREMLYERAVPIAHPNLKSKRSIIKTIRFNDSIVHFPYQSFDFVIQFLREASIDPKVKEIKMTLYRVAQNSNIVNALINAAKNGKKVVAIVELQARFDEEANIYWAQKMKEEGIKVLFGFEGMKAHSKMCLITRIEKGKPSYYANLGTGNYHEGTAKLYCDHSFFTYDKKITHEVKALFDYLEFKKKPNVFKHLLVAPFNLRKTILDLIDQEITNAKKKKPSGITLKVNHLVDEQIIERLYKASKAGVKVDIIARSTCSLVPGVKNLSENIRVISIVDKFLEHARVFVFFNNNKPLYYLSSSDLMMRNLDHRIECAFPLYDENIQKEIQEIINIQLSDNTKARIINHLGNNAYVRNSRAKKVRSQVDVYNFLKQIEE